MGSGFEGFPKAGIKFLKDLEKNNSRDWFNDNKQIYEQNIKGPAEHFLREVQFELERKLGGEVVPKLFRIHRDVRFSKDKTPYNTHVRMAFFGKPGKTGQGTHSGFYFSLDTKGVIYGAGSMNLEKQALESYRRTVCDHTGGADLDKILKGLVKKGCRLSDPDLKRVPSGYAVEPAYAHLLQYKGLAAWIDNQGHAKATGEGAVNQAISGFTTVRPIHDFLMGL
ncbi:MAG: TIGR02453 family protein [Rhodobiaceae bacterium]|nr:TIGR02453 family protein [Rhodobiaceae bacterium]